MTAQQSGRHCKWLERYMYFIIDSNKMLQNLKIIRMHTRSCSRKLIHWYSHVKVSFRLKHIMALTQYLTNTVAFFCTCSDGNSGKWSDFKLCLCSGCFWSIDNQVNIQQTTWTGWNQELMKLALWLILKIYHITWRIQLMSILAWHNQYWRSFYMFEHYIRFDSYKVLKCMSLFLIIPWHCA